MKTPAVDDAKPKRDNLGPTGAAKVSSDGHGKGSLPTGVGPSYESELENILDRKRAQTPPGLPQQPEARSPAIADLWYKFPSTQAVTNCEMTALLDAACAASRRTESLHDQPRFRPAGCV